jgi:hypothetical protein
MKIQLQMVLNADPHLESINRSMQRCSALRVCSQHRAAPDLLIVEVFADTGQTVDALCRDLVFDGRVKAAYARRIQ